MYKVFINEKKISLSTQPEKVGENIPFNGKESIEKALDLLENTSVSEICLYGEDLEGMWESFQSLFRIIHAAGGVTNNKKNEILFIYRLNKWDLPKGKLESNENEKTAAIREVEEETGISNLEVIEFLQNTYHIYRGENRERIMKITHWYSMKCHGEKITTQPQIEEGISKAEWKSIKEIQEKIFPQTFKNIQLVIDYYFRIHHIR